MISIDIHSAYSKADSPVIFCQIYKYGCDKQLLKKLPINRNVNLFVCVSMLERTFEKDNLMWMMSLMVFLYCKYFLGLVHDVIFFVLSAGKNYRNMMIHSTIIF